MLKTKCVLTTFYLISFFYIPLYSQSTGTISGNVKDKNTGETIIGANIIIEGTQYGAATDLDGNYKIKNVPIGNYSLIASYISYAKVKIENVKVDSDKITNIDFALVSDAVAVDSVLVVADASLEYEAALLNQQKKSINISDGISREQIKKSPDYTSAEFLQRLPSVTMQEGKYIYVRGVSERYSSAQLNNAPLASSEPDKKDFAFDLIPSYLVENTVVEKSYTPDNPGDFGGGLVKVNTVEYPNNTLFKFSYGTSFISGVTTKSFTTYQGGKTDYLGFDDGTRGLPAGFPDDLTTLTNPLTPLNADSLYKLGKKLNSDWNTQNSKAPLNQSFALAYGDKFEVFGNDFGLITSLNYKSKSESNEVVTKEIEQEDFLYEYEGNAYTYSVEWGSLLNISYKLSDFHKISFKNSLTFNSDDETILLSGLQNDNNNEQFSTALRYVSRKLYAGQLSGLSHFTQLGGLQLNWLLSYSESNRDEPDYRRYSYVRPKDAAPTDPFYLLATYQPTLKEGGRFYSDLNEISRSAGLDFKYDLGILTTKFGGFYNNISRTFNSRLIGNCIQTTTNFNVLYYGIDSIFAPENFRPGGFIPFEYVNGTNNYTSGSNISALYAMFELPIQIAGNELQIIAGARFEDYNLDLNTLSYDRRSELNVNNHDENILPALGLIYRLSNEINLRLSFSKTLNRPQFREIAPFTYYDFQIQTAIQGNPDLEQASISNFDFRFEMFPYIGEILSAGIFYKELRNPIEQVVAIASSGTSGGSIQTFANASMAKNYGIEIELRTSLRHITDALTNVNIAGNYARIKSQVEELNIGANRDYRPLQGQAPYVINFSINYEYPDWGSNFTVLYYSYGDKIYRVANNLGGDIIEQGRGIFDMVLNQPIGQHFELRLSAKNFVPEDIELYEGDILVRKLSTNTDFTFGVTYKL